MSRICGARSGSPQLRPHKHLKGDTPYTSVACCVYLMCAVVYQDLAKNSVQICDPLNLALILLNTVKK